MKGLEGVDSSCFMGSVICSLAYIPCFSHTLLTHQYFQKINPTSQPFSAAITDYFKVLLDDNTKVKYIRTDYFYTNNILIIGESNFTLSENCDALEFLNSLLDNMCTENVHFRALKEVIFDYNWAEHYIGNKFKNNPMENIVIKIGIEYTDDRRCHCSRRLILNCCLEKINADLPMPVVLLVFFLPIEQ